MMTLLEPLPRRLKLLLTLFVLHIVNSVFSWPPTRLSSSKFAFFSPKSQLDQALFATSSTKTTITLDSGKSATIRSRVLPITNTWNVTIWEWHEPSGVMEHYWQAQSSFSNNKLLDPFGLVSWPGSVVASQELLKRRNQIEDSTILILGAGPGVEAQAAAILGARQVIATDIHPTTLQLLRYGAKQSGIDNAIIETRVFDVCSEEPLPECDVMVAADVLYNEHLASHIGRRCVEALGKGAKLLVTDSQRFTNLLPELNRMLDDKPALQWTEQFDAFTGSGVMIDDDQTYNVTVRVLTVGWNDG